MKNSFKTRTELSCSGKSYTIFDISKIGLRSIEKIPGTFGILFDDIIGGIYTITIIYLVFLWFGKI